MKVAVTPGQPWAAMSAALDEGHSLADACSRTRLDRQAAARLTAAGAGAWVELLDGTEGARVLLLEQSPGVAGMRLAAEAAVVGFPYTDEACADFRRRFLARQPAELVIDTEWRLASDRGPWDLVIVDGVPSAFGSKSTTSIEARFARLTVALAPRGRLVVVADNRLSPLRAADRAVGRATGLAGPSLWSIERALRHAGVRVAQRFGLLRSSVDGVTAFDLAAPEATSAVVTAAAVNMDRGRATGLRVLRRLAAGHPRKAALAVPAWMVVASPSSSDWASSSSRPTGRLGHKGSAESKLLRGEPPVELEKRYRSPEAAGREAMALRVLENCDLTIAPRLLGQPASDRLRQTWQAGRPLRPVGLGGDELRVWVGKAAQALGAIQRATVRSDGTVLVHGDYWLGNLLVDKGEVVTVLDWATAHWGKRTEDLHHLIDHLVEMGLASASDVPSLTTLAKDAMDRP